MKETNRKQQKVMQELDYKIDKCYKTHDGENDDLFRIQAHYHKKIKEAGKRNVHV